MATDSHTFSFGQNWTNFVSRVDEGRIRRAMTSLKTMLQRETLEGLTFLDAGCGSGLFSLAALKLGARKVVSFDVDPDSLGCARYLKEKYGPFEHWEIVSGSVLDHEFLASLGKFDVVYSWGVLHHTGDLWQALENIILCVLERGTLFISIYNDQGIVSNIWAIVKKTYNKSPTVIRLLIAVFWSIVVTISHIVTGIIRWQPPSKWFRRAGMRGMTIWHDAVDWVGGYPFEVAKPDSLIQFYRKRGFSLAEMKLTAGSGCNEFVFVCSDQ